MNSNKVNGHQKRFSASGIVGLLALGAVIGEANAALNITMNYSDFDNNAPSGLDGFMHNDAWDATTPDSTRLAGGRAVMDEAATMIETAFAGICTDINYTINVGWEAHDDSTLATGGTSIGAGPTIVGPGNLRWDSDGSSDFFVDLTPGDNVEYTAGSDQRTITFVGSATAMNVEDRYYDPFSANLSVRESDMLSTAVHEVIHALGGLSAINLEADPGGNGVFEFIAPTTTYDVPYDTGNPGHTSQTLPYNGPGALSPGTSYYPNVIGPASIGGTRGLLTDLDILLLSNALINGGLMEASEIEKVAFPFGTIAPIPEPTAIFFLAFGGLLGFMRRRRS